MKSIDSKTSRLSPPNEKEKELSNSLIREEESVTIEFVTNLKVLLKDMEFSQKSERYFHRENNPTSEKAS